MLLIPNKSSLAHLLLHSDPKSNSMLVQSSSAQQQKQQVIVRKTLSGPLFVEAQNSSL